MFIPEELKLNKFRVCSIPSNRDYFQQFGFAVTPSNEYTGDDPAPVPMNKVEQIEDMQRYAEMKQREIDDSKKSD